MQNLTGRIVLAFRQGSTQGPWSLLAYVMFLFCFNERLIGRVIDNNAYALYMAFLSRIFLWGDFLTDPPKNTEKLIWAKLGLLKVW